MKIKQLLQVGASIAALLTLSGCFQSETTVHVKSDGSGTVVEETVLGAQMSAMLGGMGGMMQDPNGKPAKNPLEEMSSKKKAEEKAALMGEGVTVQKIEKLDKDGKKGVRITYAFKDINKLKISTDLGPDAMKEMGDKKPGGQAAKDKEEVKGEPIRFKFEDGALTILMPKPDEASEKPEDADKPVGDLPDNPEADAMAKAMFADMKMSLKVVVEPGIKKTNATHVDGNTITLMEMKFGELIQDKEGWKKFQKAQGKKPDEIGEALKDVKGVKFETKEKVEVDMK